MIPIRMWISPVDEQYIDPGDAFSFHELL